MPLIRLLIFACALCVGLALQPAPAKAASCNASMSDVAFGAVSLRTGAVNRTSGTLTIECSDALLALVGVCVRFGPGSGGAGSGNAPRYMRNSAGDALSYRLSTGGYGALYGNLSEVFLEVPILLGLGTGRIDVPIFAEILSNGTEHDIGQYSSLFSGPEDIELSYGVLSCNLLGTTQQMADFQVTAETTASCELDVGTLNFGQINGLATNHADADASVDIRCTSGTGYTVALGLGDGAGVTNPAQRKMHSLTSSLNYGLFLDAARTAVWGEAPGQRAAGTGTGYNQRYTVFGRIYSGQDEEIGVYNDNVVVTVHY